MSAQIKYNPHSAYDAFPYLLMKKITKTKEARSGAGIYNRRNNRNNRVILHLETYKEIINNNEQEILNKYKGGWIVMVKPEEYFIKNSKKKQKEFPKNLELGKNAFIYFRTKKQWDSYGTLCKNFEEVVELYTYKQAQTKLKENKKLKQWSGQYCTEIRNAFLRTISLICGSGDGKERKKAQKKLKIKLGRTDEKGVDALPAQAGLGNYDFDYASDDDQDKICYQMVYLFYCVTDFEKEVMTMMQNNESHKDEPAIVKKVRGIANESERQNRYREILTIHKKHVIDYCKEKSLIDVKRLAKIKVWDIRKNIPVCA